MADQGAVTVGTSSTELVAAGNDEANAADAGFIYITNNDSADVFIGDDTVTTTTGIIIPAGETFAFHAKRSRPLHGISAAGGANVRYFIR
jgi:hypothetical protein